MSAATASEHTPLLDASLPEPQVPRIDEETGPSNAPSNEESTELEEAPPDFSVIAVLLLGLLNSASWLRQGKLTRDRRLRWQCRQHPCHGPDWGHII